jgi:hypothetical protein
MADAANIDVPIIAPPAMSKTVVIFAFSPNPIPKETKNKTIVDAPNIIPLWAALIGKKPCLLPCATAASAMYVSNNIIATMASISEILFLLFFVCKYILVHDSIISERLYNIYVLTEQEEIKASLGIPQIFLGNAGRLNEDRFTKYYCNKCQKEYVGSPVISHENSNEELGEDVILTEKGEYRCGICSNLIALYRRFNKQ